MCIRDRHYYNVDSNLTSDAKIQPVFLNYMRGRPFPLDVQNEIQLLLLMAGLFIGFLLRNASLVKADNPISDGIVFVFFTLLDAYENYKDYKGSSDPCLT